jgi:hypothetical protein
MSATFSDLISYFKNIATKHRAILHSETKKHFFRMETDEVLAGFKRTDSAFPMLVLEGFRYGFSDNRSDNLMKNREGGFMLLDHISDLSDYETLHHKWDALETIGDEILMKIKADKRNPDTPVIRDFDFNSVDASLIRNELGNTVGIRYLFTISSPKANDVDPEQWVVEEEPVV